MINTLNPVTIGARPPLKEYIALARKYGFGGVDIGIEEVVRLGQESSFAEVKSLFDSAGVIPASFGLPMEWRKDDAAFRNGLNQLPGWSQAAQEIGCVRVCTWLPPAINDDPVHFRNQARDRFREVASIVGDYGIQFGLEWVGPRTLRVGEFAMGANEFIYNMPATLELIADIDAPHDNVGLLVDSFHWFTTGATVGDIGALRSKQIVHVHINDAPDKPRDEQIDSQRLLPGEGVIDLRGFLNALNQVGYDGPVAVETFSKSLAALGPDEAARLTAIAVESVMAKG